MAKFSKIFVRDDEKKMAKVRKYLQNGFGAEYLDDFMKEVDAPGIKEFDKALAVITENYVFSYSFYEVNALSLVPLKDIVNVYSSNCFFGRYDCNMKAIAVETSKVRCYFSKCMIKSKIPQYEELLETLKNYCRYNEGSLMVQEA